MSLSITAELDTPFGTQDVSLQVPSNSGSHVYVWTGELGSGGATTIAVPSWAEGCIIEPSTAATNSLLMALHSGDTLRNISPTAPTLISFDTANLPSDLYLESSGSDTYYTSVIFF